MNDVIALPSWLKVYRTLLRRVPTKALRFTLKALRDRDPRVIRRVMCRPTQYAGNDDQPVTHADVIAYMAWQGLGLTTVGEVERRVNRWHVAAMHALGEENLNVLRWLYEFLDSEPAAVVRKALRMELARQVRNRRRRKTAA